MMKILCNCTTIIVGGAIQAAINFIEQAANDPNIEWHFALSKRLNDQLRKVIKLPKEQLHIFDETPSRNLYARRRLQLIEYDLEPAAVFTFFGPAYVKFNSPHFMGFADPWVTHPNKLALDSRTSFKKRIKNNIVVWYKKYWLQYADYWVVEAEVAKTGIVKLESVNPDRIAVIPNSCRDEFRHVDSDQNACERDAEIKILFISAYYVHKNFEIIPLVAAQLKAQKPDLNFKFIVTLPPELPETKAMFKVAKELDVKNNVETKGQVAVVEATSLYKESHIAFIPTLLETFSATYPEAMAAGLPIVATDFDFARNVCGDAALYFSPGQPDDAAKQIIRILHDGSLRKAMIDKGMEMVAALPDGKNKYIGYKDFILDKLRSDSSTKR